MRRTHQHRPLYQTLPITHLSKVSPTLDLDVAHILMIEGINIAGANGVVVAATVLSIVGAVLLAP